MRFFFQKKLFFLIVLVALALSLPSCTLIAGKEDEGFQTVVPLPNLQFVESLRNRESLRGESYREMTVGNGVPGSLNRPSSVYADQFRVYVADTAPPGRIFIFDRTEGTVKILSLPPASGSADSTFHMPSGIAVDLNGTIFVSDSQQGKVFAFDRNGELLLVLGRPQIVNSQAGLGELLSPAGLAVNRGNNWLYVADLQCQQVKVYNTLGSHLFEIGRSGRDEGRFKFPSAVAVDITGNVYVLDSLRLRVYVFSPDGLFERSFSLKKGMTPEMSARPGGIAVDSSGYVYVTDTVFNTVFIFDNAGNYLVNWGKNGKLFGDFWTPSGIFIDSRDYIYIADQTNSRVQVFQNVK